MAFVLAAFLVALDQISKAWIVRSLPEGRREIDLGLGFHLVHIRNDGASFGMLRNLRVPLGPVALDGTLLLGLLSLVVTVALSIYLARNARRLGRGTQVALGMVLAGAFGNMIDRLRVRYVVDFIHFHVRGFDFAVFNVADASIVIGACLLVLVSLFGGRSRPQPGRPPEANDAGDDMPDVPPLQRPKRNDVARR